MNNNDESIDVRFGNAVKYYRSIAGISQEELSFRSGLHRNYISDVENGRRNVSLQSVEKIAMGLGISILKLMEKI